MRLRDTTAKLHATTAAARSAQASQSKNGPVYQATRPDGAWSTMSRTAANLPSPFALTRGPYQFMIACAATTTRKPTRSGSMPGRRRWGLTPPQKVNRTKMRNPMPRNTKIRALRTALWKEIPKSFCEPSCVPTIIARTTPPNRHAASRFNRIRCFSLMRSLRSRKQRRHAHCSLASFARSCRPPQPLAEDARGPDQQDQDQHAEADHVVPLRADEVERGDQPLGLAEDQPADHGAADV